MNEKEEIKELLKDFLIALPKEVEIIMKHIEDLKNDFGFLRNCDSDCACEISDRIIMKVLEYITK